MSTAVEQEAPSTVSITPLLKRLWPSPGENNVSASEIAYAISHIFTDSLSPVQTGALLTCLHFTGWDRKADVLAKCAESMREAALPVDLEALNKVVKAVGRPEGNYKGGASTSKSGSADLLTSTLPTAPTLTAVTPDTIAKVYQNSNYAFLFAPVFHPGMKYVAPIRKDLGWRTIFNLLGPLTNPVEGCIEARLLGVARRDIGPVFAEALKMSGARKAMIVCGEEDLDEISCAGRTFCWRLVDRSTHEGDSASPNDVDIESFTLCAADFGLPAHKLEDVSPGKEPHENAAILMNLLQNKLPEDDPILEFVLMNTSALFVVSGVCDADTSDMGHGDDGKVITERGPGGGRWKEGVRRARWAIKSGEAWRQWRRYVDISNSL
ncbi:anthranilate phosphoribosyltransferase protein [Rutstroemia sp. NJR-2017a WRK4]|nr:anthranilate phosphoribosyltransferase protein [Rutstroemia sp. NJR-2017a WRK4]